MKEHRKLQDILTCLVAVVIFICQLLNRLFCWIKNRLKSNRENISSIVTADTTILPGTISNDGNIALDNFIRVQELIQKHFDIPLLSAEQEPKVDDDVLIGDISPVSDSTDFRWPKQNLDTVEEYMVDDSFVARGLGLIAATVGRQSKFYIYSKYNDSFDGIVVELKSRKGETGKITVLGRRSKASAMQPKSIPVDYVHDDDRIKVTYTPLSEGVHTVTLSKDHLPICRSPYYVSADKSPTDCRSRLRFGGKKYKTVTRPARCKTTETNIATPETEQHDITRHGTTRHDTARHKTTGDDTDDNRLSAKDKTYEGRTDVRSIVTKFESKTYANRRNTCAPKHDGVNDDQQTGSCSVRRTFETNKDMWPNKEITENTNISDKSHCVVLAGGVDTTDTKIIEYYDEHGQELTVDQTEGNDDTLCGRTKETYSDDDDDRKTVIALDNANETDWPDQMSKILKCLCENCCKKVLSMLQNIVAGDVRVTYNDESVDIEHIQSSNFETPPAIRININIENKIQSDAHNLCLHHNSDCSPAPNENDNTNHTNSIDVENIGFTSDNSAIDETDSDTKHIVTDSGSEKQQEPITINQMESLSAKEYCSENEIQTVNAICNLSTAEISASDIANTHEDLTDDFIISNESENVQQDSTAEKTNIPSITETRVMPVMTLETIYSNNGTLINNQNKSDIDTKEIANHSLSNSTENKDNTRHETNSDSKINNFENVTPVTIPKKNDNVYIKDNNLTTDTDLNNDLVSFIEKAIEPAIHCFKDTIINTILTIFTSIKNDKFHQLEQMADSLKPQCSGEIPFDTIEDTVNELQTSSTKQITDFQHFLHIIKNEIQAKNNNWAHIKMQSKFKSIMDSIMENRTEIIHDRHPVEDVKTVDINSKIITDALEKSLISNGIADCEQIIETTENNKKQETVVPCEIETDIKEEIAFNLPGSTTENQIEVKIASQIHYDASKDTVVPVDHKINDSAIDDKKLMTHDIKPNNDEGRIFLENLPLTESFEANELSVKYKIIDDGRIDDENYTREPSTDDKKSTLQDTQLENTKYIINREQHQSLSNDSSVKDKNVSTEEGIVDEETSTTTITNSENVTKFDLNPNHGNRRLSLQEYLEESSQRIDNNQSDFDQTNETIFNDLVITKSIGDSKIVEKGNEQFEINENNVEEVCRDNSKDENEKLLGEDYSEISNLAETANNSEVHAEPPSDTNVSKDSESNNEEPVIRQQNSELDIFGEHTECSFPNATDNKREENIQECKNTSLGLVENILDKQFPIENVNSANIETELDDNFTEPDLEMGNTEHESKDGKINELNENNSDDRIFQTNVSKQSNKERSLNHDTTRVTLDDEIKIDQEISVELQVRKSSDIEKNVQSKKIICEKIESLVTRENIDNVNIPEIFLTRDEEPNTKYKDNTLVTDETLEMSANSIIEKVENILYDDISQDVTEFEAKINSELINDLERKKNLPESFETEETPISDAYLYREVSMDEIKIDQTNNDGKDVSGCEFIENYKQIEPLQNENTKIEEKTTAGKKLNKLIDPIMNVFCVENPKEPSVQDSKAAQVLLKLEKNQTCENFDPCDGVIISGEIKNAYSDKNETCADDIKDETKTNIQVLSNPILNKSFSLNETSVESLQENVQNTDLNINIEVHSHNARRLSLQEYLEDTLQSLNNKSQASSENLTEHNPVVETLTKLSDITSDQKSHIQLDDEFQVQNSEGNIDTNPPSKRLSDGTMQFDDVENNTKLHTDEKTVGRRRLSLQEYLEETLQSLDNQIMSDQFADETNKTIIDLSNQDNFTDSTSNQSNQQENDCVEKEKSDLNVTFKSHVDDRILENLDFKTSEDTTNDNEHLSLQDYSEEQSNPVVTVNVTDIDIKPRVQSQTTSENLTEHSPVVEISTKSSDITSDQTSVVQLVDGSLVKNSEESIDTNSPSKLHADETTDGRRRLSLQEFLEESLESINSSLDQTDQTKRNSSVDYDPDILDKDLSISTSFGSQDFQPGGSDQPLEKAYGIRKVEMSVQRVKSSDEEYFEQTEKICLGNDTIKEHDEAVVDDRIYTVNESDLNAIVCASSLQEALTLLDSKIKLKRKKRVAKCSKRFDSVSVDAEQNEHFAMAREYFENMERQLSKQQ
ncbi:interaptin-like isoform X2 [Adelges cooleyi]|uniref:interaptin-like isoform X2 n=1 Tax=Adelges cooleyi TaxID=133065 RepID=UPI0021808BA4|nr:interaptin-like isoform X2 [Adelges cooleyi]